MSVAITVVLAVLVALMGIGIILRISFNKTAMKEEAGELPAANVTGGGSYGEGDWTAGLGSCDRGDGGGD